MKGSGLGIFFENYVRFRLFPRQVFNDETNELEFFSAIGETGASLVQCRFPADKGIAGKALQEGLPVIVNDVQTCPYFFGNIDNESGFVTKSILAAPVIAGEEKVGGYRSDQ